MGNNQQTVRVAAVQLAAGTDVDQNLATCVRMIDRAAQHQPDLVVLPEFCNHASWYDDPQHCYRVSLELEGPFLRQIAAKAAEHGMFLVINATVRRTQDAITGTSILYSPRGERLATADKQVLMGHENDFLQPAQAPSPVVETRFGRLAMYACMDGVINETPRCLALRGAQILCNSLNSFASCEGSLHIPVRAPENRVFVVAANKVGPLIPVEQIESVSQFTQIPSEYLHGAGDSQIVAPDGTVLAKARSKDEEVVVADIDVRAADYKRRPDGTDVFAARRPQLYRAIAAPPPDSTSLSASTTPAAAQSMTAAVFQPAHSGQHAVDEAAGAVREAAQSGVNLVVLPELFFIDDTRVDAPEIAAEMSKTAVATLAAECTNNCYAVTSIVAQRAGNYRHLGVLIGSAGILHEQLQLHPVKRHGWAMPGDHTAVAHTPWGRVGIAVGDDSLYPEMFRLLALAGAEVVVVPFAVQEPWEVHTGLRERCAENRISVVAATRPNPNGTSLICTLHKDFTLLTPWEERTFDGTISYPITTVAPAIPGLTRAPIYPAHAANKLVSHRTDVLHGRPWRLINAITSLTPAKEGAHV